MFANQHTSLIISNMNVSLMFLVLPPIIALVCYKARKISSKWRIQLDKAWKLLIGEWYLTFFLFIEYNYIASTVSIFYSTNFTSWMFYVSVIEIALITGLFGFLLWQFFTKDKLWIG